MIMTKRFVKLLFQMVQKFTKGTQDIQDTLWTALDNDIQQFELDTQDGACLIHMILSRVTAYQHSAASDGISGRFLVQLTFRTNLII